MSIVDCVVVVLVNSSLSGRFLWVFLFCLKIVGLLMLCCMKKVNIVGMVLSRNRLC